MTAEPSVPEEEEQPDQGVSSSPGGGGDHIEQTGNYGPTLGKGEQTNIFEARPAPWALASLPPVQGGLTGRNDQLDELLELLDTSEQATSAVVVSALAGLAGVGKTALALHAAHQAVQKGWFPGGQLFLDLHGYDPDLYVAPEQALPALLRALGVPDVPPTIEDQGRLYRSRLADLLNEKPEGSGKAGRLLLVLDDASSAAQVVPLLPGVPEHRVLVTSRHTLASLPARLLELPVLDSRHAEGMLRQALAYARPNDARLGDAEALRELAKLCGFLPLALEIVAAILKADPGRSITDLAADLSDARTRLKGLRYDETGGRSIAVQGALELSYQRLPPEPARLFRLLPLNRGPDIHSNAAAALAGQPVRQARASLAALAQAHLLEERPMGSGRWQMHDLVHLYSVDLSEEETEREKAIGRLLNHYLALLQAADGLIRDSRSPMIARIGAVEKIDREVSNLVPAMHLAFDAGHNQLILPMADSMRSYCAWSGRPTLMRALAELALAFGVDGGDWENQAAWLTNWATTLRETPNRDFPTDATIMELVGLSFASPGHEDFDAHKVAAEAYTRALALFVRVSDRHGEAIALNNKGVLAGEGAVSAMQAGGKEGVGAKECKTAASDLQMAAEILRDLGDRRCEEIVLTNLRRLHESVQLIRLGVRGEAEPLLSIWKRSEKPVSSPTWQRSAGGC
ncbi:AAA family ATPase [Streptomyces sp. NPDC058286]|uniref:AAA family ATPase n=1 Tax=Streptomyces sp. NPDC058286 TaxID=3346422 RepID=UPI0036EA727B